MTRILKMALRFLLPLALLVLLRPGSLQAASAQLMILHQDGVVGDVQVQHGAMQKFIRGLPPGVDVAVAYFRYGTLEMQTDFTSNHEKAAAGVRVPLSAASETSGTYDALVEAVKRLSERNGKKVLAFFSDGVDSLHDMDFETPDQNPALVKAIDLARRNGIKIYTVYARGQNFPGKQKFEGTSFLNYLAEKTGGKAFLETTVSYDPVFRELKRELEAAY
ncbi:MAG TPA: hypothetical protein VGL91_20200 [Acidobacteriota bacterium]